MIFINVMFGLLIAYCCTIKWLIPENVYEFINSHVLSALVRTGIYTLYILVNFVLFSICLAYVAFAFRSL